MSTIEQIGQDILELQSKLLDEKQHLKQTQVGVSNDLSKLIGELNKSSNIVSELAEALSDFGSKLIYFQDEFNRIMAERTNGLDKAIAHEPMHKPILVAN